MRGVARQLRLTGFLRVWVVQDMHSYPDSVSPITFICNSDYSGMVHINVPLKPGQLNIKDFDFDFDIPDPRYGDTYGVKFESGPEGLYVNITLPAMALVRFAGQAVFSAMISKLEQTSADELLRG